MKVAIACDHAGFAGRNAARKVLEERGIEVLDFGLPEGQSGDYPDYAHKVAAAVSRGDAHFGVLICGTGQGMAMAANRHPGIRAAVITSDMTAQMGRAHNDANVACFGERVVGADGVAKFLPLFLDAEFEGERHARRIAKIES